MWPMDELHMRKSWRCMGRIRNVGSACKRDRRPDFSSSVDQWTRRPLGRHVCQEDNLEVRNLRQHMGDFSETIEAYGGAWQGFG